MKKSQADEDEDFIFLKSLLPSITKLDDVQRLELRIEFLSSVTRRIQISKNLLPPFNSVPTASKGRYTLVTLPRNVTPYRDSVDGTCDHVKYHKLVTRLRYGLVRCAGGIWPSHQRDGTVTA